MARPDVAPAPGTSGRRAVAMGDRATLATVVVLSAWLGAVLFFGAVVAPAAFRTLPTRTLAGALVGGTLPTIFGAGIAAGLLVLLLTIAGRPAGAGRVLHMVGGIVVAAACFLGQVVIGGRIERLMAGVGTALDALPPGDPTRVAFGRLHVMSVASLGVAALVALGVLCVALADAAGRARAMQG